MTRFRTSTAVLKPVPIDAARFAVLILCKYANMMVVLKVSDSTAMLKYMYVGQAVVCSAQAVRLTGCSPADSLVTVLYWLRVVKNLFRVIARGTKTAKERHAATRREMTFNLRILLLRSYVREVCQQIGVIP